VWGTDPQGSTVFEKQPHFSTIKALLINTAEQYVFSGSGQDLGREKQGWGRSNVRRMKETAPNSFIIDQGIPLQLNEKGTYDVDVLPGQSELKITMIYPDPPGTTSASLHRINDLDLKVTSPSGTEYFGNRGLSEGNWSVAGGIETPSIRWRMSSSRILRPVPGSWRSRPGRSIRTPSLIPRSGRGLFVGGHWRDRCGLPVPAADFTIDPNPSEVGQPVHFDSTASGGSGGPYTYFWISTAMEPPMRPRLIQCLFTTDLFREKYFFG